MKPEDGSSWPDGRIAARPSLEEWPIADKPGKPGALAESLALDSSHPQFLVERWVARFGQKEQFSF